MRQCFSQFVEIKNGRGSWSRLGAFVSLLIYSKVAGTRPPMKSARLVIFNEIVYLLYSAARNDRGWRDSTSRYCRNRRQNARDTE